MKQFLLVLTACILLPFSSQADTCTIDNNNDANGDVPMATFKIVGQQFVACETGTIQSIELKIDFDMSTTATTVGNLDLYLMEGNGSTITPGSPIQSYTGISDGAITLNLSVDFNVEKDKMYALAVGGADLDGITIDMSPTGGPANLNLPDGLFLFGITTGDVFQEQMASDLFFAVNVELTPIVGSTPIPTMSQWGLMIFGLLVLNMSVFFVQRSELV